MDGAKRQIVSLLQACQASFQEGVGAFLGSQASEASLIDQRYPCAHSEDFILPGGAPGAIWAGAGPPTPRIYQDKGSSKTM